MNIPQHPALLRKMIDSRVKKLQAGGPVLAASLVGIAKHCGRPGCRCLKNGQKHVGNYLTFRESGKTRTVYVPLDLLKDVQCWISEHHRLKQLDKEITQLTVALVKGHVADRTRRRGRR